jgi:hypothetical protein
MSLSARFAVWAVLAIQLAGASVPCPTAPLPEHSDRGALAASPEHPCPMHPDAGDPPSTWLAALCPCGCESGVAPGSGSSRTGPALLLAPLVTRVASQREVTIVSQHLPALPAPAPPDPVPLPIA